MLRRLLRIIVILAVFIVFFGVIFVVHVEFGKFYAIVINCIFFYLCSTMIAVYQKKNLLTAFFLGFVFSLLGLVMVISMKAK